MKIISVQIRLSLGSSRLFSCQCDLMLGSTNHNYSQIIKTRCIKRKNVKFMKYGDCEYAL